MTQNKNEKSLKQGELILLYLGIWVLSVSAFWVLKYIINPFFYYVVVLFLVLPSSTFVISIKIGENGCFGKWKWIVSVLSGIMHGGCWMATFGYANTLETGKINFPDVAQIIFVSVLSVIGILIGVFARGVKSE